MPTMSLKIALKASQSLTIPVVFVATYVNHKEQREVIAITYEEVDSVGGDGNAAATSLDDGEQGRVDGDYNVIQKIIEKYPAIKGKHPELEDEWLKRATRLTAPHFKSLDEPISELNSHLVLRSHVVGYELSLADLVVWGTLRGNRAAYGFLKKGNVLDVTRWFIYIAEVRLGRMALPEIVETLDAQAKERKAVKSSQGGSFEIGLPDTDRGVLTRFPPEPSGYLHIGHAKAALLNDYFAHERYKGQLLVRFDDTNPSKEKEEFQDSILEDLAMMGIKPDRVSYSSDHFQLLHDHCVEMIERGYAYADDSDQATMRDERMKGIESRRRGRTVSESLKFFEEMKNGTDEGKTNCIRAKISVDNPNKAMRDPVIYRCNPQSHHRTGTQWKVYPTYDFCCPILDSVEGVTHALRTVEYRDRNPQYEWMLDALDLRRVYIWDFSRLNFIRTLLSKRKLTKFVEDGVVWGWDDPRLPTIRGIRRRGMTIPALREFIIRQGPSRNIVNLDWTIFWATNRKFIDPVAPRHTVIADEKSVRATVVGGPDSPSVKEKPQHPKNPAIGKKKVVYSKNILLDQEDAKSFKQDEEITLMSWGNAIVRKIITSSSSSSTDGDDNKTVTGLELELHLAGDVKKTDKKITWLSVDGQKLIPVELVDFDHLITKDKLEEDDRVEDFLTSKTEFRSTGLADCNVADLRRDDIIQFERKGYFRVDRPYLPPAHGSKQEEESAVLFMIPTGKTK